MDRQNSVAQTIDELDDQSLQLVTGRGNGPSTLSENTGPSTSSGSTTDVGHQMSSSTQQTPEWLKKSLGDRYPVQGTVIHERFAGVFKRIEDRFPSGALAAIRSTPIP